MEFARRLLKSQGAAEWLFVVGLACIGLLAAALFVGAGAVDRIARSGQEVQVAHGLRNRQAELEMTVASRVTSDEAVANLDNRYDPNWAASQVGAYLTEVAEFDRVFVLDGNDRPVFGLVDGRDSTDRYAEVRAMAAPLLSQIRRREAVPTQSAFDVPTPIQASATGLIGKEPYIFVVSLVQPDFGDARRVKARAPVVVAVQALNGEDGTLLSDRYLISDATVRPAGAERVGGEAMTVLHDGAGNAVASLRWTPRRPGTELVRQIGGMLTVGVILMTLVLALLQLRARRAIADLTQNQEDLRAALVRATAADRAKSEFLASVSHEIRTPLNGILGALQLLEFEPISDAGLKLLSNARMAGEIVNALINDVLDYSRLAEDKMLLSPRPTDLGEVLRTTTEIFSPQCASKSLTLNLEAPDLGWSEVDDLRLRQCLFNLIGNAVKFTNQGGIDVRAKREGDELVISVTDTGIGIAEDAIGELFGRFQQADGTMTRRFGGAGLGLAITQKLALLMGGRVSVSSRHGEGSTFTLRVAALPCEPLLADAPDVAAAPLADIRVLLVDDNPSNLLVGSMILQQLGASVSQACSGQEAIDRTAMMLFDLILMDIQMPDLDGMAATRLLRARGGLNGSTPIIALTANVLEDQREAYRAAGMDGVSGKPISPSNLLSEIVRVLQGTSRQNPREGTGQQVTCPLPDPSV